MKYAYPAIFTPEDDGYCVDFPDLVGCHTCGDNMAEALMMASDALALILYNYEHNKKPIPVPSKPENMTLAPGEFVNFVSCDTLAYQKMYNSKAVKKTLTIPEWLNEAATAAGVNFSQTLQEALMQKVTVG